MPRVRVGRVVGRAFDGSNALFPLTGGRKHCVRVSQVSCSVHGDAHLQFSALTRNQLSGEAELSNARVGVMRVPFTPPERRKNQGSPVNLLKVMSAQRERVDMGI